MTTYTTPHFANGLPERNVRIALDKEKNNNPRAARPAVYREPAATGDLAEARTPDWQPAAKGMPKAAIGALGAALVGGAALAFVLLSPSTVSKPLNPNLVAAAAPAQGNTANASAASTDSVAATNDAAPAAGTTTPAVADTAAPTPTEQRAQSTADAARSAATQEAATPVATAPVAQTPVTKTAPATHAARRAPSQDAAPTATPAAPMAAPDVPVAPPQVVTPQAEQPAPAMQQSPDATTVVPASPATPAPDAGTSPAPAPTPGDGQ